MVIRLQVPRLALRRRLNALGGSVSRPTPWRRRPIAFLCYILSASTLRPLANRVRAAVSWLDSGKEGGAVDAPELMRCLLESSVVREQAAQTFMFWWCCRSVTTHTCVSAVMVPAECVAV